MKDVEKKYLSSVDFGEISRFLRHYPAMRIGEGRSLHSIPLGKIRSDAEWCFLHGSLAGTCPEKKEKYVSCWLACMVDHLLRHLKAKGASAIDMRLDRDRLFFSYRKVAGLASVHHKYLSEKQTRHEILDLCLRRFAEIKDMAVKED